MSRNGHIKSEDDVMAVGVTKQKEKRGRKKKTEENAIEEQPTLKQEMITDHMPVVKKRKKIDRFNGTPEEEVAQKLLPDRLAKNLDILIVGINPGLYAAYIGHHYAGPGNHFWKCLYLSGLVPEPMNCYDDIKLQEFGIGFTNMCARTTRGSADLKKDEVQEGGRILLEKLKEYKPKIAVFNGKGIYEIFSGSKKFTFGKQPDLIEGTDSIAYVMPSSSARCAQLPRAIDKVPFYEALGRLRDYVIGRIPHIDEADVTFPTLELKNVKKEDPGLSKELQEAVESALEGSEQSNNNGSQNGGQPSPVSVKQEGKKRGRPPKSKGKKVEEERSEVKEEVVLEGRSEDGQVMADSYRNEPDHPLPVAATLQQQMMQSFPFPKQSFQSSERAPDPPACSVNTNANFASLVPASSAASLRHASSTSAPLSHLSSSSSLTSVTSSHFSHLSSPSVPSTCPPVMSGVQASPHDFMSEFMPGSHEFGLVGFPNVVASQQPYGALSGVGDLSGQQPLQIKSEPAELEAQH